MGYAQSFKVDLIAIIQQNIEIIGTIKAILFSSFQLFVYIMLRVIEKAKFLTGPRPRGLKARKGQSSRARKIPD